MSLKKYLEQHFVDKTTFAFQIGISIERLDQLLVANAISGPSYSCNGQEIGSAVFGKTSIDEPIEGDFFSPTMQSIDTCC